MEINRRLFIAGMALILGVTLVTLGFWWSVKLEGPVFFEQFQERTLIVGTTSEGYPRFQQVTLQLPFVMDASDPRVIQRVEFPEAPWLNDGMRFFYQPATSQIYFGGTVGDTGGSFAGRYHFNTLIVTLDILEKEAFGPERLTYMTLYYGRGEKDTVTIGEIVLSGIESTEGHFVHKWSREVSDQVHEAVYSVQTPMEILVVRSPVLSRFEGEGIFSMTVNGLSPEALVGKTLQPGDELHVVAALSPPEEILSRYSVIEAMPVLDYRTPDGKAYRQRLLLLRNYKYFYEPKPFLDLVRYLKARGGI